MRSIDASSGHRTSFVSVFGDALASQVYRESHGSEENRRTENQNKKSIRCGANEWLIVLNHTYHDAFLAFGNFWAEFQVCCDCHGLFNGQISMQLVILHNIGAQFAELADIALFAIHLDSSIFDVCRSVKSKATKLERDIHFDVWAQ